jgi:hypothetical protein
MAIDRFNNKNILTSVKSPTDGIQMYSDNDLEKISATTRLLSKNELEPFQNRIPEIEFHIYSGENLLLSNRKPIQFEDNVGTDDEDYNILLTPETDVRLSNISRGNYSIVYNFLEKITNEVKIDNVSSDSTELELSVYSSNDSTGLKYILDEINSNPNFKEDFVLSFGDNNIVQIVGFDFSPNERVGDVFVNIPFPTSTFGGKNTTFYPEKGSDFWIEVYSQNTFQQTVQESRVSVEFAEFSDDNLVTSKDISYTTTGRVAKFNITNQNGGFQWVQEVDNTGTLVYYTYGSPIPGRDTNIKNGLDYSNELRGKPTFSTVKYYDASFKNPNGLTKLYVKLYKPLRGDLQIKNPKIERVYRGSYIEKLLVFPRNEQPIVDNFSEPNFKIDLGNYGKSQGTDLKSWNDLLDANLTTSQQIVDKYISSSFGDSNINLDYSDFANFVHYSSAVERVNNFRYKLQLVESYNSRITTLQSVSGSEAITNISQSINRRDSVVSGMDGWEKWMYYESTGSLYTHYSSSAFTFEPWPKTSESPLTLASTISNNGINYYNGLIESASYFDSINDARLTKSIPASIVEDPLNKDYLLFIDMVGHHFDITWAYIKKLTSINEREEHPFDGMPNNLLYDVAKSMGWKLTHGKDRSDLWKYALGTDATGSRLQTGLLKSKPDEQITNEVWRRIVNNIPYLLKTKGSARAVKALIATYGIPQAFLSIREYGGPMVEDVRPIWEHDKFVYHLRFDTDNYLTVPWDKITDIDSVTYEVNDANPIDTIQLFVQQNFKRTTAVLNKGVDFGVVFEPTGSSTKGNIHLYLSGSGGYKSASINDVPLFDSTMGTLLVQRESSVDDITQNNTYKIQYRRNRKDRIVLNKSASISIDGSTESSYNAAWTGSGTLTVGKDLPTVSGLTLWNNAEYLSGSIQELRYWANPLKDIVVDEHTLSRETYHGNSATSSYFDLKFRFIPDSRIRNIATTSSFYSQHPNQQVLETELGYQLSASLFNFEADDLRGVTEEYYTKVPSAGANNIMNNKVRLESSILRAPLDVDERREKSKYDKAPVDSNQVGVYLSATKMYNEDIYNHTGYFEIDDYIGNPDNREGYTEQNEELDYVRRQVFKKYSNKNLINNTIDILARYDFSVFEQIRQTMPARADYNSGILIEPHILERPKIKSKTKVSYTNPQYSVTILPVDKPLESEYVTYETTIDNSRQTLTADYTFYETTILEPVRIPDVTYINYETTITFPFTSSIFAYKNDIEDLGNLSAREDQYRASTYLYTLLIPTASNIDTGYGAGWVAVTNSEEEYSPIGRTITNQRISKYAKKEVYFYSTAVSASLGLYNSSSLVPAEVSTDELPLAVQNLRYLGCKMTSDSLTTNSPDTPDGKPVIEVFQADPKVLIYTSETADEGNLDVDVETNLPILKLEDLKVNEDVKYKRKLEYDKEVKAFRREIQRLTEIENSRRVEFDTKYENFKVSKRREEKRRDEFDIVTGFDIQNKRFINPEKPQSNNY